jgi:dTDP-4-amino-4,6-dideoxygalactose transaminase
VRINDGITPVPLLDLNRQYQEIRTDVLSAIERVCSSQQFVLGPEVEALEDEVAAYIGTAYAVGCASGTDALWLSLAAAGVEPGDHVITTPFSFFASASAIVRAGAQPIFVDVDPGSLNLDPQLVRGAMDSAQHGPGSRIKALLPVHLYGQCADMTALEQIAAESGLVLIEDAAQAIGARWRERAAGSIGLVAAFSFYPSKNLSAYGDAGMVTTGDGEVAAHIRRLRNHGSPERYRHTEFGWNARMDAIQAAVLRVKLKHVDQWNRSRRKHAETYDRVLGSAGLFEGMVGRLQTSPYAFHVSHQYVIRSERRDELRAFLKTRGIATEVYYPVPLHLQPVFAYLGYKEGDLPEAERASKEVLALPMFPELTEDEIERVVAAIASFCS